MSEQVSILCGSLEESAALAHSRLTGKPVEWIDGTKAPSFAWLVNQAFLRAGSGIVVFLSDRVTATAADVQNCVDLLRNGYAIAAIYRFAFFASDVETWRYIGGMDEEFLGGGYEDCDLMLRLRELDLAIYEDEAAVGYARGPSRWNDSAGKSRLAKKWGETPYARRIGDSGPSSRRPSRKIMPFRSSRLLEGSQWMIR